ncbi:YacP-like NYN domain protein [Rubripirellula lacrimiformis]|uniref:YacP-like NYN domain protein n=1 Tax=Rubripirellula lacrimiformis TaxID=1930273 RepID=A0A517N5X0_9BACT|nr:NYN domain-containing protein [Rubripirellula lacrimiformis]QDT02540.1 YacP-like NYN domain protein [Rubripirellula lacrimiformis]
MEFTPTDEPPRPTLWLLIDGYNVLAPTAPPRRPDAHWLHQERMRLVSRLSKHLDAATRARTCVVFDAANPPRDRPHRFIIHEIEIIFAVDYPEADDLLEELIAAHSAPKSLAVVSSDQRVQTAAKRRGSLALDSQEWLDDLLDQHVHLAVQREVDEPPPATDRKPDELDEADVADWMREFGFDD